MSPKAVNRPMLSEMLKIVGYHIPKSANTQRSFIAEKFNLGPDFNLGNSTKYPVTYQYRLYTTVNIDSDEVKQNLPEYRETNVDRESYLVSFFFAKYWLRNLKSFISGHNFRRIDTYGFEDFNQIRRRGEPNQTFHETFSNCHISQIFQVLL